MPNYTSNDIQLQRALQTSFGALPVSPNGIIIPIKSGSSGPTNEQDLKPNEARLQDGFERPGVLGVFKGMGDYPLVCNFDYFGYELYSFLGSSMADTIGVAGGTVTAGGAGYGTATAAVTGGTGSGFAGTVTLSGGAVTGIVVTNRGSYSVAPTGMTITGDGTGATVTPLIRRYHGGVPRPGTRPYTTIEQKIGSTCYQHLDNVCTKLHFSYDIEGAFDPTPSYVNSGHMIVATTSMDTTPTDIGGLPASKLGWSTLEDGVDTGIITKADITVEQAGVEVRPSGRGGMAAGLLIGSIKVTANITAYYTGDARIAQARSGVLTSLRCLIVHNAYDSFTLEIPELQCKPKTVINEQKDQPLEISLEGSGVFSVNGSGHSPVYLEVGNNIASHNT